MDTKKIYEVEDLTAKIKQAKATALIDYQNIDANQNAQLRQIVQQAGGKMQVAKNTLIKRALGQIGIKLDKNIIGPTALVFANEKEIAPLKAVKKMADELEKLNFKLGVYQEKLLTLEKLQKFVSLPSKKILLSKLVNGLNAPLQKLVQALSFNQRKLLLVLKSIQESKRGGEA